ncbi:MAG: PPC domain-containing DNA-binding protein [Elusimicrobiota bacterium]
MDSREFPDGTILLKFREGEEVISALTAFLESRKIHAGSFQAIGAVAECEIAYFDTQTRTYERRTLEGGWEILSLLGNVARVEGKAFVHAHGSFGDRDCGLKGGHVFRAVAEPTCEMTLRPLPGAVDRVLDESCGLKLWKL